MVEINRFEKIVVPVDGSEQSLRAVDSALSIASKFHSTITSLHILQYPFSVSELYSPSLKTGAYDSLLEAARNDASAWLKEIEKRGAEKNVKIISKIIETSKSIPAEIVEFAEADKVDMIVIGSRGRSGFSKLLLGSVASGVVTYANCPVLVVH